MEKNFEGAQLMVANIYQANEPKAKFAKFIKVKSATLEELQISSPNHISR